MARLENNFLSFDEWLSIYGNYSCCGCFYNNASKASCSYKGRFHCKEYESYVKGFNNHE